MSITGLLGFPLPAPPGPAAATRSNPGRRPWALPGGATALSAIALSAAGRPSRPALPATQSHRPPSKKPPLACGGANRSNVHFGFPEIRAQTTRLLSVAPQRPPDFALEARLCWCSLGEAVLAARIPGHRSRAHGQGRTAGMPAKAHTSWAHRRHPPKHRHSVSGAVPCHVPGLCRADFADRGGASLGSLCTGLTPTERLVRNSVVLAWGVWGQERIAVPFPRPLRRVKPSQARWVCIWSPARPLLA